MLRLLPVPDFARAFEEDVTGTAVAHIGGGLFEAHARDESGFGDQAGHDRMWFVARDIAFEDPVSEDQTAAMLTRMGIDTRPKSPEEIGRLRRAAMEARVLPDDIDFTLETVVGRMIGLSAHRDLRLPRVPVGRGGAGRHRAGGRGRGRSHPGVLHPQRRDAPRGLAAHRPLGDARPDLGGQRWAHLRRRRDDRATLGPGPPRLPPAAPPGQPPVRHGGDRTVAERPTRRRRPGRGDAVPGVGGAGAPTGPCPTRPARWCSAEPNRQPARPLQFHRPTPTGTAGRKGRP